MISIRQLGAEHYEVIVNAHEQTTHLVTVRETVLLELTNEPTASTDLLQAAFRFLLQRESNTQILRTFDLSVIGHYFPEFQSEMQRQWGVSA